MAGRELAAIGSASLELETVSGYQWAMRKLFVVALLALGLLACPMGRKDNQLGGECVSANDCPMGTTGLRCAKPCTGGDCAKSYCTKSCASDGDCAGAKNGAMVCRAGECAFASPK